jgi:hypothetical protein
MLPSLWPDRRRGGHQYAIDLPGYIALEAADDLSLALALLCAPRDVLLGATISSHPSQTDHVQRTALASRLPPRLRRCPTTLPVEASMGETPHRLAKDASLLNLLGLSLRPRSAAWRRGRCLCLAKRPTPGRLAPPIGRVVRLARRSLSREPRNGEPPNGARTWLPCDLVGITAEAETGTGSDEFLGGKLA